MFDTVRSDNTVLVLLHKQTLWLLHVPVTVHREQSVKKEYQQDATI